jgi:hypothetical protein
MTLPPLHQAPPEIQLAVDLIELLEQHKLEPQLVLAALAIVRQDYQHKLARQIAANKHQ